LNSLPRKDQPLPSFVVLEKPSRTLDGLTATPELELLGESVLRQWSRKDKLRQLERYGIYPIRQILFYGPPGNGKTTSCQWLGKQMEMPVYRVQTDQIVDKYVGQTSQNMAELLCWLRTAGPAIVLLDEVEQLFISRDVEGVTARECQSAMAIFWQALDRWESPQLFVFATNMPERLDKALLSRIELKLEFGPPTTAQAAKVIDYWCEIFHEHGASDWGPALHQQHWSSFRELWQAISFSVKRHALA
jgi:SpoVK/Ycf46/Vps4 family AAA+-type ATPase